jgi:hypothetical protein
MSAMTLIFIRVITSANLMCILDDFPRVHVSDWAAEFAEWDVACRVVKVATAAVDPSVSYSHNLIVSPQSSIGVRSVGAIYSNHCALLDAACSKVEYLFLTQD